MKTCNNSSRDMMKVTEQFLPTFFRCLLWVCWGWEQKHRDSAFNYWRYLTSLVLLRHTLLDSAVFAKTSAGKFSIDLKASIDSRSLTYLFMCFLRRQYFFFCDVCKYLTLKYDGIHFVILIFGLMWYSESQFNLYILDWGHESLHRLTEVQTNQSFWNLQSVGSLPTALP